MKSHGDGSAVVEREGANCMHDWLQRAQYYYRDQFILERKWYNHLLSQVYLADSFKIIDTYTHKWPKKQKIGYWALILLHGLLSVKGDF